MQLKKAEKLVSYDSIMFEMIHRFESSMRIIILVLA